jgi:hypothetical protein
MLKTRPAAHQDLQSNEMASLHRLLSAERAVIVLSRVWRQDHQTEIYDSKMVLSIPTARSISDKVHLLGTEHCKQALDWDRVLTNLSENMALDRGEINRSFSWIDAACS